MIFLLLGGRIMETKSNVNFTRTTFYAENLGEGKFAGSTNPYKIYICQKCRMEIQSKSTPPMGRCPNGGFHSWRNKENLGCLGAIGSIAGAIGFIIGAIFALIEFLSH